MGNICGCVRGPKEECYVDPKKAPLNPDSKELKGRRYFQRKKRKSEPGGSLRIPGSESLTRKAICTGAELQDNTKGNQVEVDKTPQVEVHLSRQDTISKGVYIGEIPVVVHRGGGNKLLGTKLLRRLGNVSADVDDGDIHRSSEEGRLHGISATSRSTVARDGLLVKKLLRRQLRRAISFGAVEHTLRTLRGNDRPGTEEMFAKIICGSQAHRRRRRRTCSCSGYMEHIPAPAKSVYAQHEVKQERALSLLHTADSIISVRDNEA